MIAAAPSQKMGWERFNDKCLSTRLLNEGKRKQTTAIERRKAANASIIDSEKNCRISCFLPEPSVFLTPTSFALFSERAVDRFMKLTQAIKRMIRAIMVKSLTYSIIPPVFFPFLKSL